MVPNTGVEHTPLEDNSQNVVLSIYGIEYSDIQTSIAEARRVLIDGGRLRALMHHCESSVAKMSRRALGEFHSDDITRVTQNLATINNALNRLEVHSSLSWILRLKSQDQKSTGCVTNIWVTQTPLRAMHL